MNKLNCSAVGVAGIVALITTINFHIIADEIKCGLSPNAWNIVGFTTTTGANATAWFFDGRGVRSVLFDRSVQDTTDWGLPSWLPPWMVTQAANVNVMSYSEFGWPLPLWYNSYSSNLRATSFAIPFHADNLIGYNILMVIVGVSVIGTVVGMLVSAIASMSRIDSKQGEH